MLGVGSAFLNLIFKVTDRMTQRRLITKECKDLPTNVCMVLNNSIGILPLLMIAGSTGELQRMGTLEAANWLEPRAIVHLLFSGLVGLGMSYVGLECQRVMSVTSFFVLQNVNKVFVVMCGVVIFGDPIKSVPSFCGLLLSLGGSALYGKIQMSHKEAHSIGYGKIQISRKEARSIGFEKPKSPTPSELSTCDEGSEDLVDLEAAVQECAAEPIAPSSMVEEEEGVLLAEGKNQLASEGFQDTFYGRDCGRSQFRSARRRPTAERKKEESEVEEESEERAVLGAR